MQVLNFGSAYQPGETPYQLFRDRMDAISSIVGGIKDIISNKYINKQNSMIAENIQNAIDEQKAIDLSNLIGEKPPESIYPANLEDTVSKAVDYIIMGPMMKKETMMGNLPSPETKVGPMTQKETMMGGLPTTGVLPAVNEVTPTIAPTTTEAMIPKTDLYQLYNVIKDLPTGEITWDNIYKKMTEKKPYFMGTTAPEQFVLNQMLGQVTDPRTKMASDINLAKLVDETFNPKPEKLTEWEKKTELFLQTNPSDEEVKEYVGARVAPEKMSDFEMKWNLLMQRDHTLEEEKELIGASVKQETKVDVKDIFANIPLGFEMSSFNMSTTGGTSFSFKPIDTTTTWEFNTWDEAQEFLRTHPQEGFIGKIETNKKGFDVTWSQKGVAETIKPPTYNVSENIEKGFMEKVENINDFTKELNKLKGLNIDTSIYETTEYFAELMKKKYNQAMGYIKYAFNKISAGIDKDEEGNHREIYNEYWEKARNYDQQYFNITGQRLLTPPGGIVP